MSKYIWRFFLISLLIIGFSACATYSKPPFSDSSTSWQYVESSHTNEGKVTTFIPQNEAADNWTKQITVAYYKNKSPAITSYEYYLETVVANFMSQCFGSTADIRILQQKSNEVIYYYNMHNCGKKPNHSAIGRIVASQRSISNIAYAIKTNKLTASQQKNMLVVINSMQVAPE